MNIPEAKGYSIWLMFENSDEIKLQTVIDKLSVDYNSYSFKPHLTLFKGIKRSEDLLDKFSAFVEGITKFEVNVKEIKLSEEFYKSVFLEIEKSDLLVNLFLKAKNLFDGEINPEDFSPHISLFYSHYSTDIKKRIVSDLYNLSFKVLYVNKISLCKTEGIPQDWEEIVSIHL